MRHRDAWAEERRAPNCETVEPEAPRPSAVDRSPAPRTPAEPVRRHIVARTAIGEPKPGQPKEESSEILIVASKLKSYVRQSSEMNTSDRVFGVLSDHVRALCRKAVREAAQDGRKTVLDRDFVAVLRKLG